MHAPAQWGWLGKRVGRQPGILIIHLPMGSFSTALGG